MTLWDGTIDGFAAIVIIIAVLLGIIGHFLINVALAIPFILLNNGDILKSQKVSTINNNTSGTNPNYTLPPKQVNFGDTWTCKKCSEKNPIIASICKGCGEYK